jgi:hypothetical protein
MSTARCTLAGEMIAQGSEHSIVTLICDPGERYLGTYYDADWIGREGLDPRAAPRLFRAPNAL